MSIKNVKNSEQILNLTFGQILSEGFKLFAKNYRKLILSFAVFYVLSIVINVFILTDLRWYAAILGTRADTIIRKYSSNPNNITQDEYNLIIQSFMITVLLNFLDSLIGAIFTVIAMCSVSRYLYKSYAQIDNNFYEEFKNSFNIRMLKPLIIIGILVPLGWTLFWIPGIILFVFFIFLIYLYNLENITNPISESRKISKNAILKIITVFLISIVLSGIANLIYTSIMVIVWPVDGSTLISWYNPATRNFGMILLYELLYSIIEIIFAPLFICLLTPLFINSIVRTDFNMKSQFKSPSQFSSQKLNNSIKSNIKAGIFCPFCGFKILTVKKYCPNCGKSMEF